MVLYVVSLYFFMIHLMTPSLSQIIFCGNTVLHAIVERDYKRML
jgi:hypothetical protein